MLLYPRNSHLSDIPPDFRGQPYKQWLRDETDANFARRRDTPDGAPGTKWRTKAIWNKRDDYGSRTMPSATTLAAPVKKQEANG